MTAHPLVNPIQRAQQGDPEAIALLINRTLRTRGVTATTSLKGGCLHITLTAQRAPSQDQLMRFVQKGVAKLNLDSIRRVRVVGKVQGQHRPCWVEVLDIATIRPVQGREANAAAKTDAQPKVVVIRTQPSVEPVDDREESDDRLPKRYVVGAALVGVLGFAAGGFFAVMGNSAAQVSTQRVGGYRMFSRTQGASTLIQVDPGLTKDQQEKSARTYLDRMLTAQKQFHQEHQRVATSLEELERYAAVISNTYYYRYKLTMAAPKQHIYLAAIPKQEGLHSFTAAFSADTTASGVCRSDRPTKTPPGFPTFKAQGMACAAGSQPSKS